MQGNVRSDGKMGGIVCRKTLIQILTLKKKKKGLTRVQSMSFATWHSSYLHYRKKKLRFKGLSVKGINSNFTFQMLLVICMTSSFHPTNKNTTPIFYWLFLIGLKSFLNTANSMISFYYSLPFFVGIISQTSSQICLSIG